MPNNFFKKLVKKNNPYFIAEIGVNHENSVEIAEKIIKQAKLGGANAVKFQTYKADKITSKNSPYYWDLKKVSIKSQYELFKKYDKFNKYDYIKLKKICDKYKIEFLSTPFDIDSVEFLKDIVPFFKVASADINNIQLIDAIIKTKKPILISTGASNFKEINFIQDYIKNKNIDISIMHCVLNYPTLNSQANLGLISVLKKQFNNLVIGYSDHTLPDKNMDILVTAFLKGAEIIEKHFTLDKFKGKKNNDHFHSIDFNDLINFKKKINNIANIIGNAKERKVFVFEKKSRRNARRSIFSARSLKKGETLRLKDLICKRPGTGIAPTNIYNLVGKKVKKNIKIDTQIKWSHFH